MAYVASDTNWKIVAAGDFSSTGKANQQVWHATTGDVWMTAISVDSAPTPAITSAPLTTWINGNGIRVTVVTVKARRLLTVIPKVIVMEFPHFPVRIA